MSSSTLSLSRIWASLDLSLRPKQLSQRPVRRQAAGSSSGRQASALSGSGAVCFQMDMSVMTLSNVEHRQRHCKQQHGSQDQHMHPAALNICMCAGTVHSTGAPGGATHCTARK